MVFNKRNNVKVTFTPVQSTVTIPAGTALSTADGTRYRTTRQAAFGFFRRLWWRWRCWRTGRKLPQSVATSIERVA